MFIPEYCRSSCLIEDHEDGLEHGSARFGIRHLLLDVGEPDEYVALGHAPEQTLESDDARAFDNAGSDVELHAAEPLVGAGVDQVRLVDIYKAFNNHH